MQVTLYVTLIRFVLKLRNKTRSVRANPQNRSDVEHDLRWLRLSISLNIYLIYISLLKLKFIKYIILTDIKRLEGPIMGMVASAAMNMFSG